MATTALTLGAVQLGQPSSPGSHPDAEIAGDPPQWSDGSDATYAFLVNETGGAVAWAQADPVDLGITGYTVRVRASSTDASGVAVRFGTNPGFFALDLPIAIPADGTPHEASETVAFPDGFVLEGLLPLGAYVEVFASGVPGVEVFVYEVTVTVTTTVDEVLVTRLFPRKDAHGPMGSAPRLIGNIPPERIVGGHM